MEKSAKAQHEQGQFVLDPVYRSSLVLRSADPNAPKAKFYEPDLESQQEEGAKYGTGDDSTSSEKKAAQRSAKRKRVCSLCCCYSVYISIIVILVLGIVVLKLTPKNPAVSLGDLHLTQFVYNESFPGAAQIEASLDFELNITNRNPHAEAIYREIVLSLFYRDQVLGSVPLAGFEQKRKHMTELNGSLVNSTTVIQEQADVESLKSEMAASNVQLEVRGTITGHHKVLGVKVKSFNIQVHCKSNVRPNKATGAPPVEIGHSCYYDA